MINEEMLNLYDTVALLQQISKTKYEFNFALIEIKKHIKDIAEILVEKRDVFTKERNDLIAEYCTKDKNGKAIVYDLEGGIGKGYKGLNKAECPEFDEKEGALRKARKSFMKEEIEDFDIESIQVTIKKNDLPLDHEGFTGFLQEQIQRFIK